MHKCEIIRYSPLIPTMGTYGFKSNDRESKGSDQSHDETLFESHTTSILCQVVGQDSSRALLLDFP